MKPEKPDAPENGWGIIQKILEIVYDCIALGKEIKGRSDLR